MRVMRSDFDIVKNVLRADGNYRTKILLVSALLVLLGLVFVRWLLPLGMEYLERWEPRKAIVVIKVILVLIFIGLVPFGLYLLTVGRKIIEHERFPPPGMKVT